MLSVNTRQAYTEIDNFIELLDEYNKNRVPKKLREFFKSEKDNNYIKIIDPNKPIKDQNLKEETLAIIAMLNLQYWCEDEAEKQRLKKIYYNNELKYQEELRKKYNPDSIFKNTNINEVDVINKEETNEVSIANYQETIFKRFINKVKNIFGIN